MSLILKLGPGLHYIDEGFYHERIVGMVSKGALDEVHRSPAHYRTWLSTPFSDTPDLAFGRAFHCALLEPTRFAAEYAVRPDFGDCRYKQNKDRRDTWQAELGQRKCLSAEDDARISAMLRAVSEHKLAPRLLSGGSAECTLRWADPSSGLQCKARCDYLRLDRRLVVDVKTTSDASPEGFRKSIARYRYHVQNALYRLGFQALDVPIEHFIFLAIEKEPPYAMAVYSLSAADVERGVSAARVGIDTLAECVRTGVYPGYPETIQDIDLPPWAA